MPRRIGQRPPGGTKPTEPVQAIDLYPNPLPPSPPATREGTLAALHEGFASLTDDELKVFRLWCSGSSLEEMSYSLKRSEKAVSALWRAVKAKLCCTFFPSNRVPLEAAATKPA